MKNSVSLHEFDLDNKRFTQNGKPLECRRLFNQKVMSEKIIEAGHASSLDLISRVSAAPRPTVVKMRKRKYNYYRSGRHEATTKERMCFSAGGPPKRREQLYLANEKVDQKAIK